MRLMVSGATTTVEEFAKDPAMRPFLGTMVTPQSANSIGRMVSWRLPYCLDNGCYHYRQFDPDAYLDLLAKVVACPVAPVFVTVPDQAPQPDHNPARVNLHDCTKYLFERWLRAIVRRGWLGRLPLAFVIQDGIEDEQDIPWEDIEALFIGGTDDLKEDVLVTCGIIPEAKRRGKLVHVGRVNGRQRLRLALSAGADSVDGSSLSRFPRTWIPKFIADLQELERQEAELEAACLELERQLAAPVPLSDLLEEWLREADRRVAEMDARWLAMGAA